MKIAWLCGLLAVVVASADACVQSFPEWNRGSNFSVRVMMEGTPMQGMRVVLSPEGPQDKSDNLQSSSDENGIVRFVKVKPGRYYVQAVRLGVNIGPGTVIISDRGSSEEIVVEWPLRPAFRVTTVAGRFESPVFRKEHPLDGFVHPQIRPVSEAKLTLSSVDSEKQIGQLRTDSDGNFDFNVVTPGIYLLHIEEKQTSEFAYPLDDYLLIHVDGTSSRRDLRLRISSTSCGIKTADIQ